MATSNSPDSSTPAEVPAPYGNGPAAAAGAAVGNRARKPLPRIRTHHLQQAKPNGERFAMLTAYDQYTAEIFDQAGIEVLLVGDSASNNVFGNETSLPVTVDELLPLCRAVARSAQAALVVADLPFGSYEVSAAAGRGHRRPFPQGGPGARGQDRGRQVLRRHRQGDGPGRHSGHGPHRLHAAERAFAGRLPRPGPGRRRRTADRGRRRAGRRRRVLRAHGNGSRGNGGRRGRRH